MIKILRLYEQVADMFHVWASVLRTSIQLSIVEQEHTSCSTHRLRYPTSGRVRARPGDATQALCLGLYTGAALAGLAQAQTHCSNDVLIQICYHITLSCTQKKNPWQSPAWKWSIPARSSLLGGERRSCFWLDLCKGTGSIAFRCGNGLHQKCFAGPHSASTAFKYLCCVFLQEIDLAEQQFQSE